jgi:GxxExxY protein
VGENAVAQQVVDAAFGVHTSLGPGLLESVYEAALAYELEKRGQSVTRQQCQRRSKIPQKRRLKIPQ